MWLAYYNEAKTLLAVILIESKVADGLRPGQAEDYSREVTEWRCRLGPKHAASVLIAPQFNSRFNKTETDHFDALIAIDDMADFLKRRIERMPDGELRDRLSIRIDLLEAFAEKRPDSPWIGQPIAVKVHLAGLYDRLVRERLVSYRINPTVAAKRSKDRFFGDFPGAKRFAGDVRLKHRIYDGLVCLEFRGFHLARNNITKLVLPNDVRQRTSTAAGDDASNFTARPSELSLGQLFRALIRSHGAENSGERKINLESRRSKAY